MSNYGFSYPFDGYVVPNDDDMTDLEEYVDIPYTPRELMQRYLIQFDDDKEYTFHDDVIPPRKALEAAASKRETGKG